MAHVGVPKTSQAHLESHSDDSSDEDLDKRCAICLSRLEFPAILDGCFHTFCFVCILQWSQMGSAPSCPLCKKQFKSLIHDVKSENEFKRVFIKDNNNTPAKTTTTNTRRSHNNSSRSSSWGQVFEPPITTSPELPLSAAHALRRAIYLRGLRALPLKSTLNAEILSPTSYQKNQSVWEAKLRPWITRELQALLEEEDVELVVILVLSVIKETALTSNQAVEQLREFLFEHTETFIHELLNFAQSPYTMQQYDRFVTYNYVDPEKRARYEEKEKEREKKKKQKEKEKSKEPNTEGSETETIAVASENAASLKEIRKEEQEQKKHPKGKKYLRLKRKLVTVDDQILNIKRELKEIEAELDAKRVKLDRTLFVK